MQLLAVIDNLQERTRAAVSIEEDSSLSKKDIFRSHQYTRHGMFPGDTDKESDVNNSEGPEKTEVPEPVTMAATKAAYPGMQMPTHPLQQYVQQQQQQLNPGLMDAAAMPFYQHPLPVQMPDYAYMQAPMQASMYYHLQQQLQQQQIVSNMNFNMMQTAGMSTLGAFHGAMLPYHNFDGLQQPLHQGLPFDPQAAAFHQQLLQQNQGQHFYHGLTDAGQYSALSATQAVDPPLPVVETESGGSQKTSSSAIASDTRHRSKNELRPKRPLSAYNIFFRDQRAQMIVQLSAKAPGDAISEPASGGERRRNKKQKAQHGVGFEAMAKSIGPKWKTLDPEQKACYQALADEEKKRYKADMAIYTSKQRESIEKCREELEATVSEETMQQYLASSGAKSASRKRKNFDDDGSA